MKWRLQMVVQNAEEATKIAKEFGDKLSPLGFSPIGARRENGSWIVEGYLGLNLIEIVVDRLTGQIEKYGRKQT